MSKKKKIWIYGSLIICSIYVLSICYLLTFYRFVINPFQKITEIEIHYINNTNNDLNKSIVIRDSKKIKEITKLLPIFSSPDKRKPLECFSENNYEVKLSHDLIIYFSPDSICSNDLQVRGGLSKFKSHQSVFFPRKLANKIIELIK